ncbi:hypothetical protein N8I84_01380 [Streptomyces cynarae]|uniref:Alpha-galactosidase n=1 Tax=Streptomyces cynarae TaxID=2981134 RepID=A0ABY6DT61_9ACTN|nr:hypothetical protein [Streptomyces cynarae]UXY17565.1 hypothetical protein N8I84_01380 [Streptomyces cynarae]
MVGTPSGEVWLGRHEGRIQIRTKAYGLSVAADGRTAQVFAAGTDSDADGWGRQVATLQLFGALDTLEGPDETAEAGPPVLLRQHPHPVIEAERCSTRWERAAVRLECRPETVELSWSVRGSGTLGEVHLLAGRSVLPGGGGYLPSGSSFRTLFSPNPGDPRRLVRAAGESAVVGVVGDARPGRGHWFFTPAPLCLALTTAPAVADPAQAVPEGWWTLAVDAPVSDLTFTQLAYVPVDGGFGLRLDYEGHTRVDGEFRTPTVVLTPDSPDPYEGLRRYRARLTSSGSAPALQRRRRPNWWSAPMFCGWGAQNHEGRVTGRPAQDLAGQAEYDRYLERLADQGLEPGTIVVDDKWQLQYGTCEPDPDKWPDLRGWIRARRERGQRVLLWWPAWLWEGLADELCVRNPQGRPVALDPDNPGARRALEDVVARMLGDGPGGLGADGMKIDFTARTPSGAALTHHGPRWGIALLHELLSTVYDTAKRVKPDALVVTHTPHPAFADVTDMVRLNDMLRLDDPEPDAPIVPQMRHRAAVVAAACPDLLIDTDDWCVPDRQQWREYLAAKPGLGVPALYYTTHLDRTGEPLGPEDYAALRSAWCAWDERRRTDA